MARRSKARKKRKSPVANSGDRGMESLPGRYFQAHLGNAGEAVVAHALLYDDVPRSRPVEAQSRLDGDFLLQSLSYARTQPAPIGVAQGGIERIDTLCAVGRNCSDKKPKIGIVVVIGITQPQSHIIEREGVDDGKIYLHE